MVAEKDETRNREERKKYRNGTQNEPPSYMRYKYSIPSGSGTRERGPSRSNCRARKKKATTTKTNNHTNAA